MKKLLVDVVTCIPALYVLMLGLESLGFKVIGQVLGAVLLLTINNIGRKFLNK